MTLHAASIGATIIATSSISLGTYCSPPPDCTTRSLRPLIPRTAIDSFPIRQTGEAVFLLAYCYQYQATYLRLLLSTNSTCSHILVFISATPRISMYYLPGSHTCYKNLRRYLPFW
ncbi:hypothetical protein L249_4612 [Ophiocordyceps polyrhachis-furcata BCC 54312]|uniref:Uncharacterized protein n=1 Tax=Ophiocordyceps polyrhachis-furcata BCC 54312 TaxID=1330021 RepID=A0A367LCL8_9HYPO|nr:hypothetical protein L249_4612 [Ophiocordyceps polyrhachis-furcata BCC 54312]